MFVCSVCQSGAGGGRNVLSLDSSKVENDILHGRGASKLIRSNFRELMFRPDEEGGDGGMLYPWEGRLDLVSGLFPSFAFIFLLKKGPRKEH